jgi:hypothetical protein
MHKGRPPDDPGYEIARLDGDRSTAQKRALSDLGPRVGQILPGRRHAGFPDR